MICGAIVLGARPSFAAPIAARVAAVKGDVRGSNNEPLQAGFSLRAGTGISTGADSGVLIRPKAGVDVLASMDTKISFNGAELDSKGSGTAGFTVLSGSVLVRIDEDSGDTQAAGKVNVSITTKLGVISTTNGTFSVREDKTGSLASQGLRTLLIDMDLRRPSLAKTFGLPTDGLGISDLLSCKASLKDVCIASGIDNLAVILAGRSLSTPAELLATCGIERLRALAFDAGFDRVVIDTAPIIPISDSLVLGQLVDHVFMVVRCNRTPAGIAQDAIQKLNQAGIALSGIILNRQTQRSRGYGYYYHNYYENPKEVIKSPSSTLDFPPANHVPHSSERSAPLNASRSSY